MAFNLLEDPFIPVLWLDGCSGEYRVGIKRALTQAARVRQIAASNPMDNVALLRLLLAVLQWCKGDATDGDRAELRQETSSGVPAEWLSKLDRHAAAFEVLGKDHGFLQVPAARGQATRPATDLLHEMPSGTNVAHFRHTRDFRDGLCPACCVLGLLRQTCFATASKHGRERQKAAGLNGPAPAYAVPLGKTLLETLQLSWPCPGEENDAPAWEEAGGAGAGSPPQSIGPLCALTWQPRVVWLERAPDTRGVCCNCGSETQLVRRIAFLPGWGRPFEKGYWSRDPHLLRTTQVVKKRNAKPTTNEVIPRLPGPGEPLENHAAVWQSVVEGLLQRQAGRGETARQSRVVLVGVSRGLYKNAGEHHWRWPPVVASTASLLGKEIEWTRQTVAVTGAARAHSAGWGKPAGGQVVVDALRGQKAKAHGIRAALCAFRPILEGELGRQFVRLLRQLAEGAGRAEELGQPVKRWRGDAIAAIQRAAAHAARLTLACGPLERVLMLAKVRKVVTKAAARPPLTSLSAGSEERTPGQKGASV